MTEPDAGVNPSRVRGEPGAEPAMRLIIISGLSGSGKSVALHMLEDLGYYCIDNFPAGLLGSFVPEIVGTRDPAYQSTALGVDARNRPQDIAALPRLVDQLRRDGVNCELIFLHADEEVLLERFSETRRRHPLSGRDLSLRDAITRERELLEPIGDSAHLILDTTRSTVHELRDTVRERVAQRQEGRLSVLFQSFAYKSGVPKDADFVFDVRCLPNPYWEPSLSALSGQHPKVVAYLASHDSVRRMLCDIAEFLDSWIPAFKLTNRSYLTVAIGCTGGQHRSVYVAEQLAERFRRDSLHVLTRHSELR